MKRISIRNKLYISIVPIIVIGIIASFAMLYYIANEKYVDYLYEQYEHDVEYLKSVSIEILKNGNIPATGHVDLPDSCSGIRVYDLNDNLLYSQDAESVMMKDISCCDFTTHDIAGYGRLEIYSHCEVHNTSGSLGFRRDLVWAVIITGGIALFIGLLFINRIANRISGELNDISEYAGKMESGLIRNSVDSNIKEIDNINSSLHNLGVRLAEKERLRKEKIDLLKHQINTPLTILKTTLEGMIDDVIEPDKEYLSRCLAENDRIRDKIESLYIDMASDKDLIKKEKFNLKDIINEIIGSFSVSFEQKGVKVNTELSDLTIETDKNLLVSSIYNILSNAYKYTRKGDRISIILNDRLIISDTGIGIGEEDKEKIFDAYYRGESALGIKGKGLGLYDTKSNLDKLGYTIILDKNHNETSFVIDFGLDGKNK